MATTLWSSSARMFFFCFDYVLSRFFHRHRIFCSNWDLGSLRNFLRILKISSSLCIRRSTMIFVTLSAQGIRNIRNTIFWKSPILVVLMVHISVAYNKVDIIKHRSIFVFNWLMFLLQRNFLSFRKASGYLDHRYYFL